MTDPGFPPFPVLFQDDHYVAVHKPPGLLVHRSWLSEDKVFLLQLLRDQVGQRVYPVHRLDRATSGVIVFGFSSKAARRLQQHMEEQQSGKTYHAVVRGWVHDAGVIDHPVRDKDEQGEPKEAMTKYSPLAQAELPFAVGRYSTARYTLLEVQPVTGRRHQIRKHLKHIAHPIVGDTTHGRGEHNRLFRDKFDCHRLLLQARSLAFRHPFTGEKVLLEAVDEPEWCRVLEHLGWNSLND